MSKRSKPRRTDPTLSGSGDNGSTTAFKTWPKYTFVFRVVVRAKTREDALRMLDKKTKRLEKSWGTEAATGIIEQGEH